MSLNKANISLVILAVTIGISATVLGLLSTNKTVSNTGKVKGIGIEIYKDSSFNQKLSSIDWGFLNPGENKTFTIYIRNEGNVNVTLSMTTGNWSSPPASSYIALSWNRQNYALASGAAVQATLTLSVSKNISGVTSFTFDIIITGTEKA